MKKAKFTTVNWGLTPESWRSKNKMQVPSPDGRFFAVTKADFLQKKLREKLDDKDNFKNKDENGKVKQFVSIPIFVIQDAGTSQVNRLKFYGFAGAKGNQPLAHTTFVLAWIKLENKNKILAANPEDLLVVSAKYNTADYELNEGTLEDTATIQMTELVVAHLGESVLIPDEVSYDDNHKEIIESEEGYFLTSAHGKFLTAVGQKGIPNLRMFSKGGQAFAFANIAVLGQKYNPETKEREVVEHNLEAYGMENPKETVYVSRSFPYSGDENKPRDYEQVFSKPDTWYAFLCRYDMNGNTGTGDFEGTKLPINKGTMIQVPEYLLKKKEDE